MRGPNAAKAIRITAGVMGLMMLVIVLYSAVYIAAEADHDCCGEDCPVCACIHQCEITLRGAGGGAQVQLTCIIPIIPVLLAAAFLTAAIPGETPVSGKVRLNN